MIQQRAISAPNTRVARFFHGWFMTWLFVAQMAATLIAVVSAVIDIESILLFGPFLSIYGLFIASLSFRRDRLLGLLFGLSAPTVSAFCLSLITTLEWSPGEAQVPVSALLVLYGFLCIPACALAVLELQISGNRYPTANFQYSIAAMLVLMFLLALVLGFAQAGGENGIAAGISFAYLVVLLYVLNQFFRNRRLRRLATVCSILAPKPIRPGSPFDT
jgi:hypothetical protein